MWKIFITYDDKSKVTLTGKQKEIDLKLALKYYNQYVAGRKCTAKYQQYPKKDHPEVMLSDQIMFLKKSSSK